MHEIRCENIENIIKFFHFCEKRMQSAKKSRCKRDFLVLLVFLIKQRTD